MRVFRPWLLLMVCRYWCVQSFMTDMSKGDTKRAQGAAADREWEAEHDRLARLAAAGGDQAEVLALGHRVAYAIASTTSAHCCGLCGAQMDAAAEKAEAAKRNAEEAVQVNAEQLLKVAQAQAKAEQDQQAKAAEQDKTEAELTKLDTELKAVQSQVGGCARCCCCCCCCCSVSCCCRQLLRL
jgi:hypothetical protein